MEYIFLFLWFGWWYLKSLCLLHIIETALIQKENLFTESYFSLLLRLY